jgi:hypothetical protein
MKPRRKRAKVKRVRRYSYGRVAGNYIRLFSLPGKIILFLIIIVLLLIVSIIFFKAVI